MDDPQLASHPFQYAFLALARQGVPEVVVTLLVDWEWNLPELLTQVFPQTVIVEVFDPVRQPGMERVDDAILLVALDPRQFDEMWQVVV